MPVHVPARPGRASTVSALLACLVAVLLAVAAPAGAQGTGVTVTADPALQPAFDPAVANYVTRCMPAGSVTLSGTGTADAPVSVDGGPAQTGAFSVPVALKDGQRVSFQVGTGDAAKTYDVRCLPADFPDYTVTKTGPTQAAYYLMTPTLLPLAPPYVVIFDGNGVPVWWDQSPKNTLPNDFKLLPDGNLAWHVSKDLNPNGVSMSNADHFEEHRLDGSLVRNIKAVGSPTDFHDMQQLDNGNYLVGSYRPRDGQWVLQWGIPWPVTVLDAVVQEITPAGWPVWEWNSRWHLSVDEATRWAAYSDQFLKFIPSGKLALDWRHMNAFQPDGDGLLISMRHSDAIYRIDRATGRIDWKLGGSKTPQSLTIVGDPDADVDFGGQHDVRVLPDGTVTVLDNGSNRNRAPRALRFKIDTQARTATLLEAVQDPEVGDSFCCGSARKMPGGDWVVDWTPHLMSELTPDGTPVMRIAFGGNRFSYRTNPVLPGQLDAAAVRAGMDKMHPRG